MKRARRSAATMRPALQFVPSLSLPLARPTSLGRASFSRSASAIGVFASFCEADCVRLRGRVHPHAATGRARSKLTEDGSYSSSDGSHDGLLETEGSKLGWDSEFWL
jgi:hypothetical protein